MFDWSNSPNQLARATTAVIAIFIIWLLVKLFWLSFAPGEPLDLNFTSTAPGPAAGTTVVLAPIAQYHLFGSFDRAGTVSHRDAPQTALKLQLRGLLASGDSSGGFAIIADGNGTEGVYRVGAVLPGEVRVEEIYSDRIVVSRSGVFETLRLPGADDTGPGYQWVVEAQQAPVSSELSNRILTVALPQIQGQYGIDATALTNTYGLVPVSTGGYRLSLNRGAEQMAELGLQSGDIIEAANGVALNDQAAVENVIQQVMKGQRLDLQIRRNDQVQVIQPDFARLLKDRNSTGNDD